MILFPEQENVFFLPNVNLQSFLQEKCEVLLIKRKMSPIAKKIFDMKKERRLSLKVKPIKYYTEKCPSIFRLKSTLMNISNLSYPNSSTTLCLRKEYIQDFYGFTNDRKIQPDAIFCLFLRIAFLRFIASVKSTVFHMSGCFGERTILLIYLQD